MTHTITETVDLTMPDNSVITVDLKFTVALESNEDEHDPQFFWVVEDVEVV